MLRLNLCSGPNVFPGWLNIDRVDQTEYLRILREDVPPEMAAQWPEHQRRLVEHLRGGGKIDFRVHDVREPLAMFEDGSIDAIYVGQAIEHMNPIYHLPNFLHECFELLKPGGVLRITTPDLDLLLEAYRSGTLGRFASEQPAYYAKASPEAQLCYIMYGATGPDCHFDDYQGHFFCFTRGTLAAALTEAGFTGPYSFYNDTREGILGGEVRDEGLSHSILCEAVK